VVAAMRGIALGGGCEMAVYAAKRVASMETYIGLVEVGVGLVPAGGGLAYIARRGAEMATAGNSINPANADIMKFVTDGFTNAAMAKVGTSAIESRKLGYLLWSDVVVPHKDELLFVAIAQAKAMADSGYRAPTKSMFPVAGRSAIATIKGQLANMRDADIHAPWEAEPLMLRAAGVTLGRNYPHPIVGHAEARARALAAYAAARVGAPQDDAKAF
jgi:3-hydroxyacyl-CoA dehydrogenase